MRCTTPLLLLLAAATTSLATTPHNTTDTASSTPSSSPSSTTTPIAKSQDVLLVPFLPETSEPGLCPSRTVNYITHSLPQQCLRTSRSVLGNGTATAEGAEPVNGTTTTTEQVTGTASSTASEEVEKATDSPQLGVEDEHESPLDNSKFLSFEEWKKQNLAKVGQSPENVGQGRPQGVEARRRPINNALDTLGEEGEIELDFTGFGDGSSRYTPEPGTPATSTAADSATPAAEESPHASAARLRSKDAGKTCKERFNYASFDCAATVMKTNPQCKSFQSVLVENKDSYMLNECSAPDKFLIIELCDDILVDTVVVANFEFFSSMFRTFRVAVSDRYPVKLDRWKVLGTFEARNSREIQAFLVENPLIWARYLRIEFLTHYGSEFYCPVSLVRVHGTTMMEEFRHQEDVARGEVDEGEEELVPDVEPEVQQQSAVVAVEATSTDVEQMPTETAGRDGKEVADSSAESAVSTETAAISSAVGANMTMGPTSLPVMASNSTTVPLSTSSVSSDKNESQSTSTEAKVEGPVTSPTSKAKDGQNSSTTSTSASSQNATGKSKSQSSVSSGKTNSTMESNSVTSPVTTSSQTGKSDASNSTAVETSKQSANATASTTQTSESKSTITTTSTGNTSKATTKTASNEPAKQQPPPPQPPTQDSFFKATNKRLTMLETNSSLNIQYIEEQSRILRDAFTQTEKHQLKKTENFLRHLNDTVLAELKGFRTQYDQLWQSTVIELEESRARTQSEMRAVSTRLTLLADELVWAKRMNVVQSVLLLLSLGLFVFAAKGREFLDVQPIMQQALKRSQSVWRFGNGGVDSPTPPSSPEYARVRRIPVDAELESPGGGSNDEVRPDPSQPVTPNGDVLKTPGLHFEPPTPAQSAHGDDASPDVEFARSASPSLSPEEAALAVARKVHSGPSTPSGSRENGPLDWGSATPEGQDAQGVKEEVTAVAVAEALQRRRVAERAAGTSSLRYEEEDGERGDCRPRRDSAGAGSSSGRLTPTLEVPSPEAGVDDAHG